MREELTRIRTDGERGRLTLEARGSELAALEERLGQARIASSGSPSSTRWSSPHWRGVRTSSPRRRSRTEALDQRAQWVEAERAREQRAAEADRLRFEEQLAEARAAVSAAPAPEALEALRTELLAISGERDRLADRAGGAGASRRPPRARRPRALEERLATTEAALAQANFQTPEDAAVTQELAIARQALEQAQAAAQVARAERERDVASLGAELVEARAMLARVEERASSTAVFARDAVARAERAEEDARTQAGRAEGHAADHRRARARRFAGPRTSTASCSRSRRAPRPRPRPWPGSRPSSTCSRRRPRLPRGAPGRLRGGAHAGSRRSSGAAPSCTRPCRPGSPASRKRRRGSATRRGAAARRSPRPSPSSPLRARASSRSRHRR